MRSVLGARWSCRGCGFCCRFHQLGPVEPDIVAALDAAAPAEWWPPAAKGWTATTLGPAGSFTELAKVDGHCVFLGDDLRCAVHARLGAAAKPGFCRLFPYQVVDDAQGIAVVVRSSCGGLVHSRHDGRLVDQAEDALALARGAGVLIHWAPDTVELRPGWFVPLCTWMDWEARLLHWLETAPGRPAVLLAGVRDRLLDWSEGLAGVAMPPSLPAPDPARARLAARAVLMALDMTLCRVQQTDAPPSQADADFVGALLERIRRASASMDAAQTLDLDTDAQGYVRQLLASAILGKDIHRLGGVMAGLGRFLLSVEIAGRALSPEEPHDAAAFAMHHTRIVRFTLNRSIRHVLVRARPALDDLAWFVGE